MAGVEGRSGGTRAGAGSKLSEARTLGLIGPKTEPAPLDPAVADAPDSMPTEVMVIWTELAPHALKARTLVPSTRQAFRRLCEAMARHAKMQATIDEEGLTFEKVTVDGSGQEQREKKAHPLITRAQTLDNMCRAWLKDFGIHPFGKPVVEPIAAPVDPFAQFSARPVSPDERH